MRNNKKKNLKIQGVVLQAPKLRITFCMGRVLQKLVDKGFVRYKAGNFFPVSYKPVLQYDIAYIIQYLKTIFRCLSSYYGHSSNWYDAKTLYNYFGKFCVAMTIAHKTKSKASKVFKKYGNDLKVIGAKGKIIVRYGSLSNVDFNKNYSHYFKMQPFVTEEHLFFKCLKLAKFSVIYSF